MANKVDTKYLVKQKNVWYFRMRLPPRYRHAFNGATEYKRTTGEEHLDKAIEVRDILLLKQKYLFKQIDTGKKASIPEMAQKHLKELQEFRQAQLAPDATEDDVEGASELESLKHDEILDEAQRLFPIDTSSKEFEEASKTPHGYNIIQGIKKLDKSGNAIKFIQEARGETFNSYVEDYCNYKKGNGATDKKLKEYRQTINTFSKDVLINNLNKRTIKQWARNLVLKDGMQPNSARSKIIMLKNYMVYLHDDLGVAWANIPNPFFLQRDDLPKISKTNKDRQAWTMEEMKLVYQTETPQLKKKPELKDLMVLGMVYGCRIEEICQIKVSNIVHEENIRCIFIDKSKTDAYHKFGQRFLPVVDCLNSIIDRMMEEKQPEDYLITTRVTETKSTRSDLIGGSFNRHKETLGFARPKLKNFNKEEQQTVKDFHSYRKTVNTNLQMLGLKETERNSICGWSVAFSNKQMAETAYLDNQMAYPLIDRKRHLELWINKFTFSF